MTLDFPTARPYSIRGASRVRLAQGNIRVEGRLLIDDVGIFRPCLTSALALLPKTDAEQDSFLDWALTLFNGVRVFGGYLGWAGLTPDLAMVRLPRLLAACEARGLIVVFDCLTGTNDFDYDPRLYVADMGSILYGWRNVFRNVANEPFHPSQRESVHSYTNLKTWAREFGRPYSPGTAPFDEPQRENEHSSTYWKPEWSGDYVWIHLDRGRSKWEQIRHLRELEAVSSMTGLPVFDGERMGADELDGSQTGKQRYNDPAWFACAGALDRVFELSGVFHSQAGLHGVLPGPVQQECAVAQVAGFSAIDTDDRVDFKNAGWSDSPIASFAGALRAYTGVAGNRAWTVVVEDQGAVLHLQNGWRNVGTVASWPGVRVDALER